MDDEEDEDVLLMQHHRTRTWSPLTASLAKYLNRAVPDSEKTGRAAKHYGPYTSVPLMGGTKMIGAQCGCMVFVPILTLLVFVADVALAIIAGLDMLDRGSQTPYVQFSLAIGISVMYMALCVMALTQYFWERVLDYKYHNVWALGVVSVLAWSNFGIWASWISHFHGSADGVDSADTVPFVAWAAANAVGVSGFLARLCILAVAVALRYTYDRAIEMQALVVNNAYGGSSIRDVLSGRRFPQRRAPMRMMPTPQGGGGGGDSTQHPFMHPMMSGTAFGAQQQRHYQHETPGRQRQRAPSAFRPS